MPGALPATMDSCPRKNVACLGSKSNPRSSMPDRAATTSGSSMKPKRNRIWNTPGSTLVTSVRSLGSTRGTSAVCTATMRVHLCNTLLCLRLFTKAGGALPRSLNMNTAVPDTRATSMCSSSTSTMGRSPRWMRAATNWRPRRQVVIWANSTMATSNGNQPPWGILGMLAPRNAASTTNNGTQTNMAFHAGQLQRLRHTS
ncbi:unannotated protein [freshwater metagenome]|uniref:Unannotated protein n=1 Tax=freshwater metagenome TaxID=449393 RepID=A0A6J6EDA6_9ZZZZ